MKSGVVVEIKTRKYHVRYRDSLTWAARNNRESATEAEIIIWNELLRRKQMGVKFTRQKPIDRFILDFYCSELRLAIEIDGGSHNIKKERDILRDKYLLACGIKILRFTNEEIVNNLEKVKKDIKEFIDNNSPPCQGRGEGRV